MSGRPLNLLYHHYAHVAPNPHVLELCGAAEPDAPYTRERDDDLTAIVNGFGRPEYLPLVWEAIQYQSRRPRQTWIVQNDPGARAPVPRDFFARLRQAGHDDTVVLDSGLNLGCWFRFVLAALQCRTRYVAVYDDDTLPGRLALDTALVDLRQTPGVYGGRGITYRRVPDGPLFWEHEVEGWPSGNEAPVQVDFVGHCWVMETWWLRELFRHLPEPLLEAAEPGVEPGEDMYLSFVAQKVGLPTFAMRHAMPIDERWSSLQGWEMGTHPNAMNAGPALNKGDIYLRYYVEHGWRLLRW